MNDVITMAIRAQELAYAPYSGYKVGAVVIGEDGRSWTGANVENISYGLSICAERVALCKMASDGVVFFRRIIVATPDGEMPCGACLQFMLEFAPDPSSVQVILANSSTPQFVERTLQELIPYGFGAKFKSEEEIGKNE